MKQQGFTLIELVITIAVLSFGIIGVYGVFLPVVSLNATITSKFVAAELAKEGFEVVRNIRDNGGAKTLLSCSLGCQLDYKTGTVKTYNESEYLNITADGFYGYGQGEVTKFKRKVTIIQAVSPDILKINVAVMWDQRGKPQQVETIGYLYNFQ